MVQLGDMTNEVLGAILKSIDEGIHVVNTNGITIFYNEVAAKHDGLSVDEVLGKPLLDAFPSLSKETSTLYKVLLTNKPIYNQPQTYFNKHGLPIETINTTLPIEVKGFTIGAVEIAKDYSRMKLLSDRLIELQKGLSPSKKDKVKLSNTKFTFDDLISVNNSFNQIIERAKKLSLSDSPILVYGESGTGKELFVQGVHHASKRSTGPFIAQNCAAIPEALLESILFGTAKGSYTGAVERPGLFELANGGTLFLDELHTMPIELQAKLLRVLEDGMVRRVGSSNNFLVNVRVVAAMNEHPHQALKYHRLREDLYYRLNVLMVELLPLRSRVEDILVLTKHFIEVFNRQFNKKVIAISNEVERLFLTHRWPGNVRELKHTIEYMMNICEGNTLTIYDLPILFKQNLEHERKVEKRFESLSLRKNLQTLEQQLIVMALSRCSGNINQAAKFLEIPRQTLQYKLQKMKEMNSNC